MRFITKSYRPCIRYCCADRGDRYAASTLYTIVSHAGPVSISVTGQSSPATCTEQRFPSTSDARAAAGMYCRQLLYEADYYYYYYYTKIRRADTRSVCVCVWSAGSVQAAPAGERERDCAIEYSVVYCNVYCCESLYTWSPFGRIFLGRLGRRNRDRTAQKDAHDGGQRLRGRPSTAS